MRVLHPASLVAGAMISLELCITPMTSMLDPGAMAVIGLAKVGGVLLGMLLGCVEADPEKPSFSSKCALVLCAAAVLAYFLQGPSSMMASRLDTWWGTTGGPFIHALPLSVRFLLGLPIVTPIVTAIIFATPWPFTCCATLALGLSCALLLKGVLRSVGLV